NGRWRDAYDVESAIQLAAIEDGAIVAAARLTFHESLSAAPYGELFGETAPDAKAPFAAFGRLIVHPSYEGQGLASRLDRARRRIAIAHGSRTMVAVTSNPKRITALSRCGFAPTSDAQARTEYGVLVTTLSSRAAT
ncbi:MAG: GNAT family N-acetyltransferase, partial [Hyphomonadaceae bacterium]